MRILLKTMASPGDYLLAFDTSCTSFIVGTVPPSNAPSYDVLAVADFKGGRVCEVQPVVFSTLPKGALVNLLKSYGSLNGTMFVFYYSGVSSRFSDLVMPDDGGVLSQLGLLNVSVQTLDQLSRVVTACKSVDARVVLFQANRDDPNEMVGPSNLKDLGLTGIDVVYDSSLLSASTRVLTCKPLQRLLMQRFSEDVNPKGFVVVNPFSTFFQFNSNYRMTDAAVDMYMDRLVAVARNMSTEVVMLKGDGFMGKTLRVFSILDPSLDGKLRAELKGVFSSFAVLSLECVFSETAPVFSTCRGSRDYEISNRATFVVRGDGVTVDSSSFLYRAPRPSTDKPDLQSWVCHRVPKSSVNWFSNFKRKNVSSGEEHQRIVHSLKPFLTMLRGLSTFDLLQGLLSSRSPVMQIMGLTWVAESPGLLSWGNRVEQSSIWDSLNVLRGSSDPLVYGLFHVHIVPLLEARGGDLDILVDKDFDEEEVSSGIKPMPSFTTHENLYP